MAVRVDAVRGLSRIGSVIRHFIYGSNLLPARLAQRAEIAHDLGACRLPGWALRFHKRGADGSAKADIVRTGCATDVVHGALVELRAAEAARLDGFERGYRRHSVAIDGLGLAFAYVADAVQQDPRLVPYDWYVALIVAGARARKLPGDWLMALADRPVQADPDPARAALARALLHGSQGL